MKWRFQSRAEVVPALEKTRGNLHQTYDVIVCANRQGYGTTPIRFYEGLVLGHTFDASAEDSASYAFSYDANYYMRLWNWKNDADVTPMKSGPSQIQYFRDRALSLRPSDPYILIMRAVRGAFGMTVETRNDGYKSALKAVKYAPNWADAYFWLGRTAYLHSFSFELDRYPVAINPKIRQNRSRLGHTAMAAYNRAERLDPSIRPYLHLERLSLCDIIADKKSAQMIPAYLNAHLRAFPRYSAWLQKRWGESESQFRRRYADLAAKINQQLS